MAENLWYYARDNQQMGPVSSADLKRLAAAGQLSADDLIWREGMEEWAPASRVKGLFPQRDAGAAEPAAPALAPVAASAPPPASDVRLAEPLPATSPPLPPEPPASAPPPAPATQPATAPAPATAVVTTTSPDPLSPGLRLVLILAQAVLWATCVMVVILGGLMLLGVDKSKAGAEQQAVSAAVSCSLFVGSYVLARAGQQVVGLVEDFLRLRHR